MKGLGAIVNQNRVLFLLGETTCMRLVDAVYIIVFT